MASSTETPDQQEIRRTLHALNQAWVEGHPDQIANFLHAQVVFVSPDLKQRGVGREDCVASYVDFSSQAKIHSFNESAHAIDVIGDAAVATYAFEIHYEMNGKTFRETGHDLFVFTREGGEWKVVWRTLLGMKGGAVAD
jgi:ketosteroid isomerase-like protein